MWLGREQTYCDNVCTFSNVRLRNDHFLLKEESRVQGDRAARGEGDARM